MHVHVLSKVIEIHEEEQYVMHETCCELSEVAVNANSNAPLQHFGGRFLQCITTAMIIQQLCMELFCTIKILYCSKEF